MYVSILVVVARRVEKFVKRRRLPDPNASPLNP